VKVACSVHQEFKKISLGSQKPQDLVRLGPGVVSNPEEVEVWVACDIVVFANAVPDAALSEKPQRWSQRILRCGNAAAPVAAKTEVTTARSAALLMNALILAEYCPFNC
jgi:hypothetical protein